MKFRTLTSPTALIAALLVAIPQAGLGSPIIVGAPPVSLSVVADCNITSTAALGTLAFGNVDPVKHTITHPAPISSFTMSCNAGTQWAVDLEVDPAASASFATAQQIVTGAMTGAHTGHQYPFTADVIQNGTSPSGGAASSTTPYTVITSAGLFPTDDAPVDSYIGKLYITLYFE
ncbi:MAG TPA: hypothetical protein VK669_09425 [Candidatus Limnocylindrales bacterium]|nr:hypothetical protein [Candidatus Limnocylindrales bacterium]